MNHKKIIVVGVVVLGVLTLFMFSDYKKNGLNGRVVSPNILYLTQPITSFSGVVDKIAGNTITISQKQTHSQNIMPPPVVANLSSRPSPFPTPKTVILTYQVVVTDRTQINQSPAFVNYLFKVVPPAAPLKSTIKDIKVGQYLTINSQVDLRTLMGNVFEATTISLPQKTNTLNGKVVNLEGSSLTVKGFAPMAPLANPGAVPAIPQEKEYRISITSDTEISRMSFTYSTLVKPGEMPQSSKSERLSITDLKKDVQVTIYTAEDVNESQSLMALRIEPQIAQNIPPLIVSPDSSASALPTITP